ncbi:probable protein SPT2 homolog at C-terminar half [Coccomyxa sp. Obi]|nr:probable protein SPT2 homolog at C-terminar half [Coccomyxa sp. Obi]
MKVDAAVEASRAKLANMKSFFGGKLSTREACAIRSLTPEAPPSASTEAPAARKIASGSKPSSSAGSRGTSTKIATSAAQKRNGRGYMDFSSLDDDDAAPSAAATLTPGQRALAAVQAVERMRQKEKPAARPRPTPSPPPGSAAAAQLRVAGPARSSCTPPPRPIPGAAAAPRYAAASASAHANGAKVAKVVHARSKFGAAARGKALPPQAMMTELTERQKAEQVMQRLQANSQGRLKASQASPAARVQQPKPSQLSNELSRAAPSVGVPAARAQQQRPSQLSYGTGRALTGVGQLGSAAGPGKRGRDLGVDDEYDSDFVDSDDDGAADWRSALRSITKYDPRKFNPADDNDRGMVASAGEIEAEERRSRRMAAAEDRADMELEAQRAALKAARKEKAKRARGGSSTFLLDD